MIDDEKGLFSSCSLVVEAVVHIWSSQSSGTPDPPLAPGADEKTDDDAAR